MDDDRTPKPFDSIEDAQGFMGLLASTIDDSVRDLDQDRIAAVAECDTRRVQAIDLALYKLKLLSGHVQSSSRILNDLRSLRRLLLQERTIAALDTDADPEDHLFR